MERKVDIYPKCQGRLQLSIAVVEAGRALELLVILEGERMPWVPDLARVYPNFELEPWKLSTCFLHLHRRTRVDAEGHCQLVGGDCEVMGLPEHTQEVWSTFAAGGLEGVWPVLEALLGAHG